MVQENTCECYLRHLLNEFDEILIFLFEDLDLLRIGVNVFDQLRPFSATFPKSHQRVIFPRHGENRHRSPVQSWMPMKGFVAKWEKTWRRHRRTASRAKQTWWRRWRDSDEGGGEGQGMVGSIVRRYSCARVHSWPNMVIALILTTTNLRLWKMVISWFKGTDYWFDETQTLLKYPYNQYYHY